METVLLALTASVIAAVVFALGWAVYALCLRDRASTRRSD